MFYKRELQQEVTKYLADREAIIILGSRQVGKTTLLKMTMQDLKSSEKVYYLDLEDPRNLDIVEEGVDNLVEYITVQGASTRRRNYVFLDEIHYMKNPSRFIKLAVDHYSDKLKLICTGSSALGIKMKFHDALVGRKLLFTLYPLNFREFLIFKERPELAANLPTLPFSLKTDKTRFFMDDYLRYFYEFLIWGSYPRIVLENTYEKKEKLLAEIVSSYIYKDIRSLFDVPDITKFNKLVKVVARQIGSLVNVSEIARTVGISRNTVQNYLSILEGSFLIVSIPPYSKSVHIEVRKAKKIYWLDNGLRNYLIGDLSVSHSRGDIGFLLENVICAGLLKRMRSLDSLYYWRTKDRTEVDFVFKSGRRLIPIEVKISGRIHRGFTNFMKRYKIAFGFIAHLGGFTKGRVSTVPAFWLA